ncbi:peptidoglycan-binding protein [Streptomyces sp. NPDC059629]|uniref:peptidoglycan-binding protein n=1 Tax=Streptomyces sp. NPDC059629 TaxID=3346889 RepID=UPI00367CF281
MPTKRLIAIAAAVVAVSAGVLVHQGHSPSTGRPAKAAGVATVTVSRTDLSDTTTLAGTLGYGGTTPVTGHGAGVVTSLPDLGATIKRGHPVYQVNDQPVDLFYGACPLYRKLAPPSGNAQPMQGKDVTVVADNLVALGYDIGSRRPNTDGKGDSYTASLSDAVKRWQKYAGMNPTGTLDQNQILVLTGPVRVASVAAHLGDPSQGAILAVTSTGKQITVPVPASDAHTVAQGATVKIALPDGRTVTGAVSSVGQSVQSPNDGDSDQGGTPPSLTVTVTPSDSADVAKLQSAPVQVTFTTGTRHDVLAVPVTALVALKEGGYALQRPDGTFVAVTTGLFADGKVEVSGAGVTAGMRVEAAS